MPLDTMEPLAEGIGSLRMSSNSIGNAEYTSRPPHPPSTRHYRYEGSSSRNHLIPKDHVMKASYSPSVSTTVSRSSYKTAGVGMQNDADSRRFHEGKEKFRSSVEGECETEECNANKKLIRNNSIDNEVSGTGYCSSPHGSFYSATQYTEAKQSFTNTEVSECSSSVRKSSESGGEVSNSCEFIESGKTSSIYRGSTGSDISEESSSSSYGPAMYKPHKANDSRWEAIKVVRSRNNGALELKNFRIFKRLGCGDIGSVHLAELIGTKTLFAMKVMDKEALASRKKILRAQTERDILQSLDHPFLPTLYTHFETEKFSFLVMEYCPGGDLHALRQKQPGKFFPEHAAR